MKNETVVAYAEQNGMKWKILPSKDHLITNVEDRVTRSMFHDLAIRYNCQKIYGLLTDGGHVVENDGIYPSKWKYVGPAYTKLVLEGKFVQIMRGIAEVATVEVDTIEFITREEFGQLIDVGSMGIKIIPDQRFNYKNMCDTFKVANIHAIYTAGVRRWDAINQWNTYESSKDSIGCKCGKKLAMRCPGEFEKGCDMGANEAHVKPASKELTREIDKVLAERGTRYGPFEGHATLTQGLKEFFRTHAISYHTMTPTMKEAIDMIFHKLGRIGNGDPFYDDSWIDIAGYTQLVIDELPDSSGCME